MSSHQDKVRDQVVQALCENQNLEVFEEGDRKYDDCIKKVFNEIRSNKPRAFIRPKAGEEISHVLQYASANHIQVSILGGGHDPKGPALIQNGFVLDMSAMKGIDINMETATAWVEAGVTIKELDDVTCPLGLAAVNGSCTDVGVIGFTLGGGFGFLSRTQGLAVDNSLQMEVITGTGQRVVASPQDHAQLFWALRGAGHLGYGVVTKTQIKLHQLQKKYYGGRFHYIGMPTQKLREFLNLMNRFCKAAEDEITFNIYLITQLSGVVVDYFYDGPPSGAETKLIPFLRSLVANFGPPEEEKSSKSTDNPWLNQTTSYLDYQQRYSAEVEKTEKMWKSAFLKDLTPEVIEIIINQLKSAPTGPTILPHTIGLELLGGEINRRARDSCAYAHRDALFLYSVQAMWKRENETSSYADACKRWAETAAQSLLAHSLGSYQNYADCGESTSQERLKNWFGQSNLKQLKILKKEYDPHEVLTRGHFQL